MDDAGAALAAALRGNREWRRICERLLAEAISVASITVTVTVLCVLSSVVFGNKSLLAAGGNEATHSMAKILLNLTHCPTGSQKATLRGILDDETTTAMERVLAEVLMKLDHDADRNDQPRLQALVRSESAPAAIKMLATILSDLSHTPTDVDKQKLRQLLQPVAGTTGVREDGRAHQKRQSLPTEP